MLSFKKNACIITALSLEIYILLSYITAVISYESDYETIELNKLLSDTKLILIYGFSSLAFALMTVLIYNCRNRRSVQHMILDESIDQPTIRHMFKNSRESIV